MTEQTGDKHAFFISPIGDEGSEVRQRSDVVKRLILEAALCPDIVSVIERADEHANPGEITPAIIAAILEADLIVVDLTGANPNVYYEMAVAHAYGKPTVHIRLEDEPLPFDIKDVRVFPYRLDLEGGERARVAVRDAAQFVLQSPQLVRTPVSGGTTLLTAALSGNPAEQLAGTILRRLDELDAAIKEIDNGRSARRWREEKQVVRALLNDLGAIRVELGAVEAHISALAAEDGEGVDPYRLPQLNELLNRANELAAREQALLEELVKRDRFG